jgi:hypothetical protein
MHNTIKGDEKSLPFFNFRVKLFDTPGAFSELKKLIQKFQNFTPGIFKFSSQTRFIFESSCKILGAPWYGGTAPA